MPDLKGKTIIQMIPGLNAGGAERSALDVAKGIVEAGGKAIVASAGGHLVKELNETGAEHVPLPLQTKFRLDRHLTNWRALLKLCRSASADLIHARSRAPAFISLLAARQCKLPFLTTYHGIYSEPNRIKNWYNSIMVSGDAVIANSHYTARLIKQRYKLDDGKIHVIHRGTDMDQFDKRRISAKQRAQLKKIWHLPDHQPVVMLLARLTDWKGHLLAVHAASLMKQAGWPVPHFVFAGAVQSETYAARVRSAIVEAGLMTHFTLPGHIGNPALALSLADLVIVPSTKPEAFGRSVAEAAAASLPVIAFDHGGATETILSPPTCLPDKCTGLRIPLGDAKALANAIHNVLSLSSNEREAMGERGRAHIEKNFNKKQMVRKTLLVYQKLMKSEISFSKAD